MGSFRAAGRWPEYKERVATVGSNETTTPPTLSSIRAAGGPVVVTHYCVLYRVYLGAALTAAGGLHPVHP